MLVLQDIYWKKTSTFRNSTLAKERERKKGKIEIRKMWMKSKGRRRKKKQNKISLEGKRKRNKERNWKVIYSLVKSEKKECRKIKSRSRKL